MADLSESGQAVEGGTLSGVNVLDLSRVLAGPWCTQILGDLGANVIKVERPGKGDDTRSWGPPFAGEQSAYFLCANRNKRSVAINFEESEDLKVIHQLLENTDVLVENYKVGGLARWGLDYPTLKKAFPKLIYCSISGYGDGGPMAKKPGYDALIQAFSGLMNITGHDQPTKVGVAVSDILTGLYCSTGLLAALYQREKTGRGQHLKVSLLDTQVACLANVLMSHLVSGEPEKRYGNAHPSIVPYRTFETADQPLMLGVGNDQQFAAFCSQLGQDWHKDEKFATNPQRVVHRKELESLIQKELKSQTCEHWLERLDGTDIPAGPVHSLTELQSHPQVQWSGLFRQMTDSQLPCVKSPMMFSEAKIEEYKSPPRLPETNKIDW